MSQLNKDEMFGNLQNFLKSRGINLQEGSYTKRIRKACGILTDSINLSQRAFSRAKGAVDTKLERLRQVIHQQTAPKPPPAPARVDGVTGKTPGGNVRAPGKTAASKPKAAGRKRRSKGK